MGKIRGDVGRSVGGVEKCVGGGVGECVGEVTGYGN